MNIKCVSYNDELAAKFARDFRTLIRLPWYREIFGNGCDNPTKDTEKEFETRAGGGRFATSLTGTLTGYGADFIVVDDPMKAVDGKSDLARKAAKDWYTGTAISRENNPGETKFILVMQRLHAEDLAGYFLERGCPSLVFPAIATERTIHKIGPNRFYTREIGEVLNKRRDSREVLENIREQCGSMMFAAQYQQNPTPPDGNLIMKECLKRYDRSSMPKRFDKIIIACDPSGKAGENNDYTAIVVVGILKSDMYLLDARRGHWTILRLFHICTFYLPNKRAGLRFRCRMF